MLVVDGCEVVEGGVATLAVVEDPADGWARKANLFMWSKSAGSRYESGYPLVLPPRLADSTQYGTSPRGGT